MQLVKVMTDLQKIKDENPEILEFAKWMHDEIKNNQLAKGDWRENNTGLAYLMAEFKKHIEKMEIAMYNRVEPKIKEHLADNFCYLMYLAKYYELI